MKISRTLAVAMSNADTSELNEAEIELIKDFPYFTVNEWPESNDINGQCSITGKWDTVVEIDLLQPLPSKTNIRWIK